MPARTRSLRQEQIQLVQDLRAQHRTWVEVADVMRQRYRLNARTALRLAHGWSQTEAATEWTRRWPADPKTFKNFSYWEVWPARTGHAPSLDVLTRLAELYGCRVSDLLIDCPDYRDEDPAHRARAQLGNLLAIPTADIESSRQTSHPQDGLAAVSADIEDNDWPQRVDAFVERIEDMALEDFARTVASWAQNVDSAMSRRSVLLKISAGLSLAAADLVDKETQGDFRRAVEKNPGLAGIWLSRYLYSSSSRAGQFSEEHYVVFREQAGRLIGHSLPHSTGSELDLRLSVEGAIATGTWTERTSPDGHYRGATYHGTLQLVVNPMGREMSGKWLGFSKNFKVNTGDWELTWIEAATSARTLREYDRKI